MNKEHNNRVLGTFGIVIGLALAAPLYGQTDTDDEEVTSGIEEIVVTARQREENAQEVPIPITVVSDSDLRERSSYDLTDLSRVTPNLSLVTSGTNRGSAQVFLRGIGQVNWSPTQDPKVGIYVDGVYLGRPQGSVFDIMDIERIEVLRGPQGTLFGRNTTAGLTHVVTRKPQKEFEATLRAGVGSDDLLLYGGVINVPLTDSLAMRASVQHREADGYVLNRSTGNNWNNEDTTQARFSLLYEPSERFDLQLGVDTSSDDERPTLGSCEWAGPAAGPADPAVAVGQIVTGQLGGLPLFAYLLGVWEDIATACNDTEPFASDENDPEVSTVDTSSLNLTVNADVGVGTLTSITSTRSVTDFNGSWGWGTDKIGTPSYLEVLGVRDNTADQFSQELRLAGSAFDDRLDWVAGLYVFEEDAEGIINAPIFRDVIPQPANSPLFGVPIAAPIVAAFGLPPIGVPWTWGTFAVISAAGGSRIQTVIANNSSTAIFGEVTWRFADRWALTAGLRHTTDDRDFTRRQILSSGGLDPVLVCPDGTAPVNGMTCQRSESFTQTTPRLIFNYQANDDVLFYGGYSRGYSSGGFNQDVRMRPFDPETSDNWEFGMKSIWFDRSLQLNLTAFFTDYRNQQITVSRIVGGLPTADLINAQQASLQGTEAELRWVPGENWQLTAALGTLGGHYDEFSIQDNAVDPETQQPIVITRDLSDSEFVRNPDYTLSLSGSYTFYLSDGGQVAAQLGISQFGRSYSTLETLEISKQEPYALVDGRVTWTLSNQNTSMAFYGRNLTDEMYFGALDLSGGLSPTHTVTKYWGAPQRFGLEVTHNF